MEETTQKYYPLGKKTLFMFIFRKSAILFLLLPLLIAGLVILSYIPYQYLSVATNIIFIYTFLVILTTAVTFFVGWLQYFRYAIFVDYQDLKIQRGFIATEEVGIPYRHIKDLKIERSLIDQIFGVSDIIVTVLGQEEKESPENESETEIILPAVEKNLAVTIQNSVLKRAQVDQVHMLKWGKDMV